MADYRDKLDEIFITKLQYTYEGAELSKPDIEGKKNILYISLEYATRGVSVILVECKDRIPEFQKRLIKKLKNQYPDAHFLFVSNSGSVYDLYNVSTSKKLKKITYNEIDKNTRLFNEKIELFNVETTEGTIDLKIQIDKAFDASDRVTKKFFDKFEKIHKKLQKAIQNIENEQDVSWYASVLMNRIMFIYFLQKHRVLQDDPNFLLTKYDEVKMRGEDYYKDFLLPLFFYGFARRDTNSEKQRFTKKYGYVKYLNGGLFYPHHIEKKYTPKDKIQTSHKTEYAIHTGIKVDANALCEILEFLNGYTWYLDNRPMKDDTDINPDVLGYIFEKYINQKELGAYYTKEDITEYISKNTIIPFILDKLRTNGYQAPDPTPMITQNENIIGNMADYLEQLNDYDTFKFLFKDILQPLTVLDPAVGSGAFLFAALNILLPIYRKTVFKLRSFQDQKTGDQWLQDLCATLDNHSEEYYLTKQIILNNLYGVDIVEEATEICKLRLFLQLASHLPDIKAIEPLPDIDFNIYAGNSLVGGLSWEDLEANYTMDLFTSANRENIKENIEKLTTLKNQYKQRISEQITELNALKERYRQAQQDDTTEEELNTLKHSIALLEREINNNIDIGIKNPFHWFVDYHQIMQNGGFDVIIGNPPYVEYSKVRKEYEIKGFDTVKCGNLYANFIERGKNILSDIGNIGMIIPVASVCTDRLQPLQNLLINKFNNIFISSYNDRPSKLFDGIEHIRLSIIIAKHVGEKQIFTTKYNRWFSRDRDKLFKSLNYTSIYLTNEYGLTSFPKVGSEIGKSILSKILGKQKIGSQIDVNGEYSVYYTRKLSGFVQILNFIPIIYDKDDNLREPSELKSFNFSSLTKRNCFLGVLNSSLFYWFLTVFSDCRNLNKREIFNFPFDYSLIQNSDAKRLSNLTDTLMSDINAKSEYREMSFKSTGRLKVQCTFPKLSKSHIDKIDVILGRYYGFDNDELEYIINYDSIFRVGK